MQNSDSTPAGAIDLKEICDIKGGFKEVDPGITSESTLFLPYSGGTTGLPKGVELTHKNIVANLCQVTAPLLRLNVDTEGTKHYTVFQTHHIKSSRLPTGCGTIIPAVIPHLWTGCGVPQYVLVGL